MSEPAANRKNGSAESAGPRSCSCRRRRERTERPRETGRRHLDGKRRLIDAPKFRAIGMDMNPSLAQHRDEEAFTGHAEHMLAPRATRQSNTRWPPVRGAVFEAVTFASRPEPKRG